MAEETSVDVVIVGAGLAGLYQLHRLRQSGFRVRVLEVADDVGGTWYWNCYPGARCDVEAVFYSYSFSPELEQEWTWTEKYPSQPEILSYINHVVDRYELRQDISFGSRVTTMSYEAKSKTWRVATASGNSISAQFVIMATGCLSASKPAEIAGIEKFGGEVHHTGKWPHNSVDFEGRRVGVIGTGSSGIQCIPVIASQAAALTVFQRTPSFSLPARNRRISNSEAVQAKRTYPELRLAQRSSTFGIPVTLPSRSALEVSEQERSDAYKAAWNKGDLVAMRNAFSDIGTSKSANETASEFIRGKIRAAVVDPQVAETLSPRGYPYGTKRPCLDSGYYEVFNWPHVQLVDLRKTPMIEFTENGLRTVDQEYQLDVVVFATGFDAMTGALMAIDIRGKDGTRLSEKWRDGPRTYLGLAVGGFPNMFTVTGPLSPSVLSNMVVSIEQHVDWITRCIEFMRDGHIVEIEARRESEDEWVEHVAQIGAQTLLPSADSWYMGANVVGKPRVLMAYVGGIVSYREKCDDVAARDYEGFVLASHK